MVVKHQLIFLSLGESEREKKEYSGINLGSDNTLYPSSMYMLSARLLNLRALRLFNSIFGDTSIKDKKGLWCAC